MFGRYLLVFVLFSYRAHEMNVHGLAIQPRKQVSKGTWNLKQVTSKRKEQHNQITRNSKNKEHETSEE